MKHKLSMCILIPTLALLYSYITKIGIKVHALSLHFISAACFSAFIVVAGPLLMLKILNFFLIVAQNYMK